MSTSQYVPKFDYRPLSRENVNGKRQYVTPNGKVPSVTTILEATKPAEAKKALYEWRKRVGPEKAQAITTDAANRGTRMHTYLETYVKTGLLPPRGSNPFSWASHMMAEQVIGNGLCNVSEYWGVEVPLYFPEIYAGTTDCCGVHNSSESILDFKQTNKPKKEEWIDDYKLQLVAYATAHNEVYKTNINKGVILMCIKPELHETTYEIIIPAVYQEFIIEGNDFNYWTNRWWERVHQFYSM